MKKKEIFDRRDFLKVAGIGGVVFASGLGFFPALGGIAKAAGRKSEDFYFLQLSDTHWGFDGPKVNPESKNTLKKAIESVNSLKFKPDFIVFTGDLTHTTDDEHIRRARMEEFREIIKGLNVQNIKLLPGEHDASLDQGAVFKDVFKSFLPGDTTYYTFIHKGVHFIALDNVSDAEGAVGDVQIAWLKKELAKIKKDAPLILLTHRPLFDLKIEWDWATKDGKQVVDLLLPYKDVTVFYGHIHQENHHKTGHIVHHSAKSLIFPLPPPSPGGSTQRKAPIQWDVAQPFRGLGFRSIQEEAEKVEEIKEWPVVKG